MRDTMNANGTAKFCLAQLVATPAALEALEDDHEFLLKGGVFTEDLINEWITYKRTKEIDAIRLRPHPYEFVLSHDI